MTKEKIIEEIEKLGKKPPKIFYYDIIDSTNTRAREYAKEHPECREPIVFIANAQSAGRGRRGRSFVSNEGAGIYVSILIYPSSSAEDATTLTAKAAVALSHAVEKSTSATPRIKWVNDLYLGGKKLAGILCEGESDENGNLRCFVCGMGINVYKNAISDEISDIATSIESESGERASRSKLAANIITEFLEIAEGNDAHDVYLEYKSRSFVIGKDVTVLKLSDTFPARVIDIDRDYALIIEREGGERERLFTGEVSLKITK